MAQGYYGAMALQKAFLKKNNNFEIQKETSKPQKYFQKRNLKKLSSHQISFMKL